MQRQAARTGAVRICDGAMDFDVDFNNGDAGCPLAVLSSPRLPKACKRHTIISTCKNSVGEKGAQSRTGAVRICDGAMDFDVDFNNGDEGNTLAVLSSPRC